MIELQVEQGTPEWLAARAGVITASRFRDALEQTGGLTEQQALYVSAIKGGETEAGAMRVAGYKAKPRAAIIDRALQGLPVTEPSYASNRYAWLIALERIAGEPLDDTFVTWEMRRGQENEPRARDLYMVRTGRVIDPAGIVFTDDRLFGYSTDGKDIEGEGGIEVKVPSAPDKVGMVWTDPASVIGEYEDQINGGLWITGWKWIDLVIYTPWLASVGKDLFIHRFHRNDDAIERLERDLWAFAQRVKAIEDLLRKPIAAANDAPWVDPVAVAVKRAAALVADPFVADPFAA